MSVREYISELSEGCKRHLTELMSMSKSDAANLKIGSGDCTESDISLLIEHGLTDRYDWNRMRAVTLLGKTGSPRVVEHITNALFDGALRVKESARDALLELCGRGVELADECKREKVVDNLLATGCHKEADVVNKSLRKRFAMHEGFEVELD